MNSFAQGMQKGMQQGLQSGKQRMQDLAKTAVGSVATQMSLPMVQEFRKNLEKDISNTGEWEKRPVEDRQAVFNEIKAISKLLHKEGYRANVARNMGWSSRGGKSVRNKKVGKKGSKVSKKSRKGRKH